MRPAVIMTEGPRLTLEDLDLSCLETTCVGHTLKEAREAGASDLVLQSLARNQGNVTRTAAELGVSRPTLHALFAKYGIERQDIPPRVSPSSTVAPMPHALCRGRPSVEIFYTYRMSTYACEYLIYMYLWFLQAICCDLATSRGVGQLYIMVVCEA